MRVRVVYTVLWHLRMLGEEDKEFQVILGYRMRLCLKENWLNE